MVALTEREQLRIQVLNEHLVQALDVKEVAERLSLSERQVRRLRAAYAAKGASAIAHGNRGRPAANRLPEEERARIVELARTQYSGINDTHLSELLWRNEGIAISRPSLRRMLRSAGVKSPQKRRPPKHRQRRERMVREGMLVLLDASLHPWFGPGYEPCTLVGSIDDATGKVLAARFQPHEDTLGYFLILHDIVLHHGVPEAFYVDRHTIFINSLNKAGDIDAQIRGAALHPSQVHLLCSRLGAAVVFARSPQAKGRIERLWRTFQDRLVHELDLAAVRSIDAANRFLPQFLQDFNARFAVPAANAQPAYQAAPDNLSDVFARRHTATVLNDHTIQKQHLSLQLCPEPGDRSYVRCRVEVFTHLDGHFSAHYKGRTIPVRPAPQSAPKLRTTTPPRPPQPPRPTGHLPPPNHPWRRPWFEPQHPGGQIR